MTVVADSLKVFANATSKGALRFEPAPWVRIKEKPVTATLFPEIGWLSPVLGSKDILGLQALGALLHLELHLRPFFQILVTAHLYSCEVHKHVLAVRALDE